MASEGICICDAALPIICSSSKLKQPWCQISSSSYTINHVSKINLNNFLPRYIALLEVDIVEEVIGVDDDGTADGPSR